MAIAPSEIKFYLSGGPANALGDAALGGVISGTEASSVVNELFDYISADEAYAGESEYRCVYLKNTNASETLYNTVVWVAVNTPDTDTSAEIGLGTSAVNGVEPTIADENTAPAGVTFSAAPNAASSLSIGDIPSGEHKAVWIKRTVSTSTISGYAADYVTLYVRGGTAV